MSAHRLTFVFEGYHALPAHASLFNGAHLIVYRVLHEAKAFISSLRYALKHA